MMKKMKFTDLLSLALHSIKNNKSRSILTTIIVFVISILIISLSFFGLSFSNNLTNINKSYIEQKIDCIDISYYSSYKINENTDYYSNDDYMELFEFFQKRQDSISIVIFESFTNNYVLTSYQFGFDDSIDIVEGKYPQSDACNTNQVLVSTDFINRYYEEEHILLKVGDEFDYKINNCSYDKDYQEFDVTVKIVGIYKPTLKKYQINPYNQYTLISKTDELILDFGFYLSKVNNFRLSSIHFYHIPLLTNFSVDNLVGRLESLIDELNAIFPKNIYSFNGDSEEENSVNCSLLDEFKAIRLSKYIILAIISFMCLILMLLSIGSLANSIMISVDNNKKFIGLLKALGLNERDLKGMIKLESLITILLGITIAYITVLIIKPLYASLNYSLVYSTNSDQLRNINYDIFFESPLYVPAIVCVFFVLLTILFSRTSISKIAKMDPMAVISEVA